MKKFLSFILSVIMLISAVPAFAAETKTGDISTKWYKEGNVYYKLENHILTVSGKGKMMDYQNFEEADGIASPFYKDGSIWEVVIEKGVTNVGDAVFAECVNLKKVTLPKSINRIGDYAFYNCNLKESDIPKNVDFIGRYAFCNCFSLKKVNLPDKISKISGCAFENTMISSIAIPNGVEIIEGGAFRNCGALEKIVIPKTVKAIEAYCFDNSDLTDVYYFGTKEQFKKIKISEYNYPLKKASVHYLKNVSKVKPAVSKISTGKTFVKISVKEEKQVSGYQIQLATNSKFTENKKSIYTKKTNKTIKDLKKNKKYYIRVRAYKTVCGKKYYSKWSEAKKITTKK